MSPVYTEGVARTTTAVFLALTVRTNMAHVECDSSRERSCDTVKRSPCRQPTSPFMTSAEVHKLSTFVRKSRDTHISCWATNKDGALQQVQHGSLALYHP